MNKNLKGVVVGAGYFSHFHYEAWSRIPEVQITALSDLDSKKASAITDYYQISNSYTSYKEMILNEKPDFIDIIKICCRSRSAYYLSKTCYPFIFRI